MFFCPELIFKKGHPFFLVWMAATHRAERLKKYLTPQKAASLDIRLVINDVLSRVIVTATMSRRLAFQNGCLSLYLSAQLMYGCCVVLNKKATILFSDADTIYKNLRKMRFNTEKSKLMRKTPQKSKKKHSTTPKEEKEQPELAAEELIDEFNVFGLALVDSEEPMVFANSALESTITMQEAPFPTLVEEDTRFGDEENGGFLSYFNAEDFDTCFLPDQEPGTFAALPDTVPNRLPDQELQSFADLIYDAHFALPSLGPQASAERVPDKPLEVTSPIVLPDLRLQSSADKVLEEPLDVISPIVIPDLGLQASAGKVLEEPPGVISPIVLPDMGPQASADRVPEEPLGVISPIVLPDMGPQASADRVPEEPLDVISPIVLPDMGPQATADRVPEEPLDVISPIVLPDMGPQATADRVPEEPLDMIAPILPPYQEPQTNAEGLPNDYLDDILAPTVPLDLGPQANSDRVPEELLDATAPIILPDLEPQANADGVGAAQVDVTAPIILPDQEEGAVIELAELSDLPQGKRVRRRRIRRVDESIKIPSAVMQDRIRNKACDTLRASTFEEFTLMQIKTKWLNLSAMTQPGRSGNLQGSLRALFSRNLVTSSAPDEDVDETIDHSVQNESTHGHDGTSNTLIREGERSGFGLPEMRHLSSGIEGSGPHSILLSASLPVSALQELGTPPNKRRRSDSNQELQPPADFNEEFSLIQVSPKDHADPELEKGTRKRLLSSDQKDLPSPKKKKIADKERSGLVDASVVQTTCVEGIKDKTTAGKTQDFPAEPIDLDEMLQGAETGVPNEAAGKTQDFPAEPIDLDEMLQGAETGVPNEAAGKTQDFPAEPIEFNEILQGAKTGTQNETAATETLALPDVLETEESGLRGEALDNASEIFKPSGIIDNLQDQIQSEDPLLLGDLTPMEPLQKSSVDKELMDKSLQDSGSSSSDLRPCIPHDVLLSAAELARERNENIIPIAVLCPPSSTNRLKAASIFSALLDLHKEERLSLRQERYLDEQEDQQVSPISIDIRELP